MSSLVTQIAVTAIGVKVAADATKKGARESAGAIDRSTDAQVQVQREALEQQERLAKPWIESGVAANQRLENPYENFQKSFDYDWRRGEGQRDLNNLMSVKGGGGNTIRAAVDYNQNFAGQEFNNWWNRQSQFANRGQAASAGQAANVGNAAANIGTAYSNQGNMLAQNAWNRASGVNEAYQGGIGNMMYIIGNRKKLKAGQI